MIPSREEGLRVPISPTKDEVMTALMECYDPEIPVNIVDLGLIYDIRITSVAEPASTLPTADSADQSVDVEVEMTMTSPGCPSHVQIGEQVTQRVMRMPGVRGAKVNVVWSPPWGPERISPAAKQKLGIG